MGGQAIDPVADGIDGLFGPMPLDRQCDRGLGAVEQDDPAELLVRRDVIVLVPVPADEIHQGERVVGVLNGLDRVAAGPARRRGDGRTG